MPTGLQIFAPDGTVIVDTTSSVLRELVVEQFTASTTDEQSVSIDVPPNTTLIAQITSPPIMGQNSNDTAMIRAEGGVLIVKFYAASGINTEARALLF